MSLHQIIYTSCMRGINGVNDGQQVYSYDASFIDANNDEVKSLFSYQPPVLDPGVIMTEEIAVTLPKSFTYRKLNSGVCALALSTYLGRDYMGSAGRFGNHLSHVIVFDEVDLQNYPCEFYGSRLLRDHMEYEEVNNPNRPDFLPEPVLERGFIIDIDVVIDFLSVAERMEVFKNMLHAVLSFESQRKRVVICDEPENIILWIAAVEYTLPLKMALGINFTTYEFDPSLSASQICGVIPKGSRYNMESKRLHFVFDLYENSCAEFEKDEHFYDFIDTAMSFSYDSLQDFQRFILEGYTYDKADERMYAAYRLYTTLSDGILGMNNAELSTALDFAADFALPKEHQRILDNLIGQKDDLLRLGTESFLSVVQYAISNCKTLPESYSSAIKAIMVDRVLYEFLNSTGGEDAFISFYNDMDGLCRKNGFSVAIELMKRENSEKLFAAMRNDISTWEISFIVKVVTAYVKDQRLSVEELLIDMPLGRTYYGLVQAVYSQSSEKGFFLVSRILEEFSFDCRYLVNMALNIEGMLQDLAGSNQEIASLWKYFGQAMIKYQSANFKTAYAILSEYQRYEQVYMLYSLAMSNAASLEDGKRIFSEHYNSFVVQNRAYADQFAEKVLTDYYRSLENSYSNASYDAKAELLCIVSSEKINVTFAENLIRDVINKIPYESPSKEDGKLIQISFKYLYNDLDRPVTGKLLLLVIAMALQKCKKVSQLHDTFESLETLTKHAKADMSRMTERDSEQYFEWVLPEICELCLTTSDIESLFNLFIMPNNITDLFFTMCAKIYLKQSKGDKEFGIFCEYLGLVLKRGTSSIFESVGKVLCKLNKSKLAELDEVVNDLYRKDRTALGHWKEIREAAESTNPILTNLTNLFRHKKD